MTAPNVVIVHEGNQAYVNVAVDQARRSGNDTIHVGFERLSPLAAQFDATYRHMSTNSRTFEVQCFRRYFAVQQLMQDRDLQSIFHLDSDVLLFEDLQDFEARHLKPQGAACGIHMPVSQPHFRCSYSPHTSYWTRPAIDSFCEFLVAAYANPPKALLDKWTWHQENNAGGGICDMTLLYLWAQSQNNLMNFAARLDSAVFDHNINAGENLAPNEYKTRFSKKAIVFRDGQPFCRSRDDGQWVRFRSLHFQGHIKSQMARVSQGKGIDTWAVLKTQAKGYAGRYLRRG